MHLLDMAFKSTFVFVSLLAHITVMFICHICTRHMRIRPVHVVMHRLNEFLYARYSVVSSTAVLNLSLTLLIVNVLDVSRQVAFAIMHSVARITMMFFFMNFLNMSIYASFVLVSLLAHITMVLICCQVHTRHIHTVRILVFVQRSTVLLEVRFLGVSRIAVLDLGSALVFVNVFNVAFQSFFCICKSSRTYYNGVHLLSDSHTSHAGLYLSVFYFSISSTRLATC